jgi:hypothetical protein
MVAIARSGAGATICRMGNSTLLILVLLLVGARWARLGHWRATRVRNRLIIQPGPPARGQRWLIRLVGVLLGLNLTAALTRVGLPLPLLLLVLAVGLGIHHGVQWEGWARLQVDREANWVRNGLGRRLGHARNIQAVAVRSQAPFLVLVVRDLQGAVHRHPLTEIDGPSAPAIARTLSEYLEVPVQGTVDPEGKPVP